MRLSYASVWAAVVCSQVWAAADRGGWSMVWWCAAVLLFFFERAIEEERP